MSEACIQKRYYTQILLPVEARFYNIYYINYIIPYLKLYTLIINKSIFYANNETYILLFFWRKMNLDEENGVNLTSFVILKHANCNGKFWRNYDCYVLLNSPHSFQ